MENIETILSNAGITIPADKKAEFDELFNKNYKTIAELNGVQQKLSDANNRITSWEQKYNDDIAKRDNDIAALNDKLKDAVDPSALDTIKTELANLQTSYNDAKTQHARELADQKYEFALREKVNTLKFSSNAAKKAFLEDVKTQKLAMSGEDIMGFDDFVTKYKETDIGAFVIEETEPTAHTIKPTFSSKSTAGDPAITTSAETNKPVPRVW